MQINKKNITNKKDIYVFLKNINFILPKGFINFFSNSNGGELITDNNYVSLWPLTDMIRLNKEYNVEQYAPEFFIFASDGGDEAYAIEKTTGYIYEMPFVGMSVTTAILRAKTFNEFLNLIKNS
jgi:hypothetical protein